MGTRGCIFDHLGLRMLTSASYGIELASSLFVGLLNCTAKALDLQ